MGQTPSSTSRLDNASTRTLHSTSIHSNQPRSFFGRLSNRFHKPRRFHRRRTQPVVRNTVIAPSTSSSMRHETPEVTWAAAAAAAAATMTSPSILYHLQNQSTPSDSAYGDTVLSHNNSSTFESPVNTENTTTSTGEQQRSSNNQLSFLALFQLPGLPDAIDVGDILDIGDAIENLEARGDNSNFPVLFSLILLSYFDVLANDTPGTSFRALQRSSPENSNSSTEALTPSSNNNSLSNNNSNHIGDGDATNDTHMADQIRNSIERYFNMMRALGPPFLSDNATYEELLMLETTLGRRPNTTTQAAVDEAVSVTAWSESTKKELIGADQCLVCLDEFVNSQAVRILKCRHVFHRECVDRWLVESHNSCPVCRRVPVESNN